MPQAALGASLLCLPSEFTMKVPSATPGHVFDTKVVQNWYLFFCVAVGLWGGLMIGLQTEFFTSNAYQPVQVCPPPASSCTSSARSHVAPALHLDKPFSRLHTAQCLAAAKMSLCSLQLYHRHARREVFHGCHHQSWDARVVVTDPSLVKCQHQLSAAYLYSAATLCRCGRGPTFDRPCGSCQTTSRPRPPCM